MTWRNALRLLVILGLTLAAFGQGRWEYITMREIGNDWTLFYLDLQTIERPNRDVVIYWSKFEKVGAEPKQRRIKMWRNRTYQFIDLTPPSDVRHIPPDSAMEIFYERLLPPTGWEYIGKTDTNVGYYLDLQTIERANRDVVTFWYRTIYDGTVIRDRTGIKMRRNRTYQDITENVVSEGLILPSDAKPIPPASMMETFYKRLFLQTR